MDGVMGGVGAGADGGLNGQPVFQKGAWTKLAAAEWTRGLGLGLVGESQTRGKLNLRG